MQIIYSQFFFVINHDATLCTHENHDINYTLSSDEKITETYSHKQAIKQKTLPRSNKKMNQIK